MKESTLIRNHSDAQSVTRNLLSQAIWRSMKESTLVRSHSAAQSVTTSAQHLVVWRPMNESILMRSHSAAQSVTRNSVKQLIWRPMKEPILMRSHSAAQNVTRNSVKQLIWRPMRESILWETFQLLPVWLQMLNIRCFKRTWKNPYYTGHKPFSRSIFNLNFSQARNLLFGNKWGIHLQRESKPCLFQAPFSRK